MFRHARIGAFRRKYPQLGAASTFPRTGPVAGFTIAEVMVATFVLLLGICSAIFVIQAGFRALDTARNTTLAAQVLQSEMERIRLLPWNTSATEVGPGRPSIATLANGTIDLRDLFPAGATTDHLIRRFTLTRTVTDVPDRGGEMKIITLTITWRGIDGMEHTRSSSTRYARHGLYDYYYTRAAP
jgi:hypothetical protein